MPEPLGRHGREAIGHAEVVQYVDPETDRPGWLALRRAGIGGSDVAAILGQSPYRSALHVWFDKVGSLPDEQPDNERMMWGRILEPIVADVLADRTGVDLVRLPVMLRHPEHEWMLANVDRVAADPTRGIGLAEIKTAGYHAGVDWADDRIPDAYMLQGQHYLAVTGHPYVLFGCLVGGQKLETRWMARDDELIAHMLHLEAEFWQMVEDRTPPPPDGSDATKELLAHLWDVQADLVATLDPAEVGPIITERQRMASAEKQCAERRQLAENQLRWMIGEAAEAIDPEGHKLFTWKANKNGVRTLRFPKPTPTTRKALPNE